MYLQIEAIELTYYNGIGVSYKLKIMREREERVF